jgi:hypothetical protein
MSQVSPAHNTTQTPKTSRRSANEGIGLGSSGERGVGLSNSEGAWRRTAYSRREGRSLAINVRGSYSREVSEV